MQELLISDSKRTKLAELKGKTIIAAAGDFTQIDLQFPKISLRVGIQDETPASTIKGAEVLLASIDFIEGSSRQEGAIFLQASTVERVLIARTLLYFDGYAEYSNVDRSFMRMKYWWKRLFLSRSDFEITLEKALTQSVSGFNENTVNPKYANLSKKAAAEATLLDAGILIVTDKTLIPAFTNQNSYGFPEREHFDVNNLASFLAEFEASYDFEEL